MTEYPGKEWDAQEPGMCKAGRQIASQPIFRVALSRFDMNIAVAGDYSASA